MLDLKLPETKAKTVEERLEELAKSGTVTRFEAVKDGDNSVNISNGLFRTYPDGIEALTGNCNNLLVIALYSHTRKMIIKYSAKNENKE